VGRDRVGPDVLTGLAARFEEVAKAHLPLNEAVSSYLAAAGPVEHPVHYPRVSSEPVPESYEWFVKNDRVANREVREGWALPHVRAAEQRLPYLPKDRTSTSENKRQPTAGKGRGGRAQPRR
jgi:hypothetical protein